MASTVLGVLKLARRINWTTTHTHTHTHTHIYMARVPFSPKKLITISVLCPPNFLLDSVAKKCYTLLFRGEAIVTTAIRTCEQLYPGAKLPELRSIRENIQLRLRESILVILDIFHSTIYKEN